LYAILRSSIKHSLGQFNVAPILDFDRDPNLDTPYQYQNKEAEYPTIQVDRQYNPFSSDTLGMADQSGVKPSKSFALSSNYKKPEAQPSWESLYVGLRQAGQDIAEMTFENDAVTSSLFEENEMEQEVKRTYQIQKKYIVSPIKSGMVIINQKRAHERVLYEEFLTNMTVHQASSQQLLFPLQLYYSSAEIELIAELKSSLENTGFVFETINEDNVVISGLPVNVTESEITIVLEELLSDLQDGIPDSSFSQNDTIAKSMAKSLAVKTGTYLSEKEQENLVHNLFACKEPNVSPFQKPTFITMSVEDLDKKFSV
jgi:DNA mismatch repair protein MutL